MIADFIERHVDKLFGLFIAAIVLMPAAGISHHIYTHVAGQFRLTIYGKNNDSPQVHVVEWYVDTDFGVRCYLKNGGVIVASNGAFKIEPLIEE